MAARVDRRAGDGQGETLALAVGSGSQLVGGAIGRVERGDLIARLATDRGEEAADVNELTGN